MSNNNVFILVIFVYQLKTTKITQMKWMYLLEFITSLAEPAGNMRWILCSNFPPERAQLARREFPILIQRKKENYLDKQVS